MKRFLLLICTLLFLSGFARLGSENPATFENAHLSKKAPEGKPHTAEADKWEAKMRAIPKPENLRAFMKRLSARPNHLGSPYGKDNADWMLAKFKEWGLDAKLESYNVLFPSPKKRVVELLGDNYFKAKLEEPTLDADATSGQKDEQLPTYNAYSIDGDVTGQLVFVNYGIPSDYEYLARLGISVKGKIVIAKYGGSWRGIKPKVAAENGAIGCLIYSDPADDGFARGDVYPDGPYRRHDGVQRGSVMDMPLHPGDPLTPGIGATMDAKRLDRSEAKTLTKIPVLPISHGDALPLLKALEGPVVPARWRGGLPITYHVGPSTAKVHLQAEFNWDMKMIYNVVGKIKGSEFPDEWIIRGNHRDAWVNGASDPMSGMVALMEEARAMGELVKQGWRPKRTLYYIGWDAEEQGLIGSTEWAEHHAAELKEKAALYINTDGTGRGYLGIGGSHTLEKFINTVAHDIKDPETKLSVWKRGQLRRISFAKSAKERQQLRATSQLKISALGSGSDYTAFLDHLGIASLNMSFGGEGGGGVYHSIFDSFDWYTKYSDTDFVYGRALAQTCGTAVMRFANAEVLPFDFKNLGRTVATYLKEIKATAKSLREHIIEKNRQLDEGLFAALQDPKSHTVKPPKREAVPPFLNFSPLENAIDKLKTSAQAYEKALSSFHKSGKKAPAGLNKRLLQIERKLSHSDGLPGRPWFKHQMYAPGFYTGYGVKTIPAVREAVEQKKWNLANAQIAKVSAVLENFTAEVNAAAAQLQAAQ